MSFAIGDDDAMVGISIPDDVADNMMNDGGFGLEEGEGGFGGAEESGFGHDENFEVFFEKADQQPEKRRRTLEAAADEEQARACERVVRACCARVVCTLPRQVCVCSCC